MKIVNNNHFVIIAGEPSGDFHGSKIIANIKTLNPLISFSGLGGPLMKQEGLVSLESINKLAVMGFGEVLKNLFFFLKLEKLILTHISNYNPEKIILIDYPGFNLRLARKIKAFKNIPIIYYISPQLWAWKEKRIINIKKNIDKMIVVFPFEKDWYQNHDMSVKYFGHPLVENLKEGVVNNIPNVPTIALCPGSRLQEIKKHMPVFANLIKQQSQINHKIKFIIIKAPGISVHIIKKYIKNMDIKIENQSILNTFFSIDLAIVSSGTATLECAVTLTPMVVIYKMSPLSWFITKLLINSRFASIINIIAGEKIIPELLQSQCTAKNIIHQINILLMPEKYIQTQNHYMNILKTLNKKHAYKKASEYILNFKNVS